MNKKIFAPLVLLFFLTGCSSFQSIPNSSGWVSLAPAPGIYWCSKVYEASPSETTLDQFLLLEHDPASGKFQIKGENGVDLPPDGAFKIDRMEGSFIYLSDSNETRFLEFYVELDGTINLDGISGESDVRLKSWKCASIFKLQNYEPPSEIETPDSESEVPILEPANVPFSNPPQKFRPSIWAGLFQ